VAAATARPGWSGLRATREGRVVALDTAAVDVLSRAGPRMGEAVRLLARVLHPGRF
jgi:iron complex transport system substrate-binding protein